MSGGTTDALLVRPDKECVIYCERVAGSLDLKAGQLIDRVGLMLGLSFPAGPALERLALTAKGGYNPRPVLRDGWCCLSGVENQCRELLEQGAPNPEIALFCLMSVLSAMSGMTRVLTKRYPKRPLLYAGGVMSNSLIRQSIEEQYGGFFAPRSIRRITPPVLHCLLLFRPKECLNMQVISVSQLNRYVKALLEGDKN